MQLNTITLQAVSASPDDLGNALIERIRKGDVSNSPSLEERPGPNTLGTVDDLVGDNEITRLDLLLQASNGREGDYGAHADGTQSGDVGAGRNLMRRELVMQTVTAEEGDCDDLLRRRALVVEDGYRGGWLPPGRGDGERGDLCEAGEFAKAGTTDHGDADGVFSIWIRWEPTR